MGRQRQLRNHILTFIFSLLIWNGCTEPASDSLNVNCQEVTIKFNGPELSCKSMNPDENKITDISLMIFDEYGTLEQYRWIPYTEIYNILENGIKITLVTNKTYHFRGCVNFGYRVYADRLHEIESTVYHLVYPDDFREGIPMCIEETNVAIKPNTSSITLKLKRLMAKISLRIDRSRLDEDVRMNVINARIGNCPRQINVFGESHIKDESEKFTAGYSKNEFETENLNKYGEDRISGEVSLYMLENMQGEFKGSDIKEFPEGDLRREICSYLELELEYLSEDKASWSSPLKYRFYLGEDDSDLNVERNCHYHITVRPENDGLSKDGWCIDKSGLCTFVKTIHLSQASVSFSYEGESVLLETDIIPSDATFKTLSWESSNVKVAEVSDTGLITATGEGTCTITCRSIDGNNATAQCHINNKFKQAYMNLYPSDYILGNVGDKVHIWCDFFPPNAPFDIGLDELEEDRKNGLYEYKIDDNGHGVTLTLKNPGRGIIYMSAGFPINDSKMAIVEINQTD